MIALPAGHTLIVSVDKRHVVVESKGKIEVSRWKALKFSVAKLLWSLTGEK